MKFLIYILFPIVGLAQNYVSAKSTYQFDGILYGENLCCERVLPVDLLNIDVFSDCEKATITWQIANEVNNRGYYIQASTDAIHYKSIGFVYSGTSKYVTPEIYKYYRLISEDLDGKNYIKKAVHNRIDCEDKTKEYYNYLGQRVPFYYPNFKIEK